MAFWLLVIILAYLFFSLSFFADKLVLGEQKMDSPVNAMLYTFYVGALGGLAVLLIPFASFTFPQFPAFFWILLESIVYVLGLYSMFTALGKFEVSRVMTTIGATQPVIVLLLVWILWGPESLSGANIFAFSLLLIGSIIISIEKKITMTRGYLALVLFASFMFSLDYVFSKMVFLNQPFLQGLIWMRLFAFALVLLFLLSSNMRSHFFSKKSGINKKTGIIFLLGQGSGAMAGILQSLAISLTPVAVLPIINSLRGVQYVFLFIITLGVSWLAPKFFKEDISQKAIIQKLIAIILIVIGLAILI